MRGIRLHRLIQVLALLRGPSSWNARRLAEHFQTSRRNIYRDMAILELAGVPFFYDPDYGQGGGYRIRESFFFPAVGLSDQECLDLAVMTKAAETKSIPLLESMSEVRDKVLQTLPAKQQDLIAEASEMFDVLGVGLADHGHCRTVMLALQRAMLAKLQVDGTYLSPHQKKPVRVQLQPRRVFLAGPAWYLAAHDNHDDQTKLYRLARFKRLDATDRASSIDPTFSLRDHLGNAWVCYRGQRDFHLEIRFNADAAPLVAETRWHHTQEIEAKRDGSCLFRATVSGLDEVKYWVLQWGPRATVLKPRELADEVRRLAEQTAKNYQPSPSGGGKNPQPPNRRQR